MEQRGLSFVRLWEQIETIVVKCILSIQPLLGHNQQVRQTLWALLQCCCEGATAAAAAAISKCSVYQTLNASSMRFSRGYFNAQVLTADEQDVLGCKNVQP